jgi:uncharacterized protein YceK
MNWRAAVGCGLATLAISSGGCGTVRNLQQAVGPKDVPEMPPDAPMKRVYGGVRSDWSELAGWQRDPEAPHPGTYLSALIDLPLSAVGDTLTLPYTLAWEKGLFGMRLMNYPPEYATPAAEVEPPVRAGSPPDTEQLATRPGSSR